MTELNPLAAMVICQNSAHLGEAVSQRENAGPSVEPEAPVPRLTPWEGPHPDHRPTHGGRGAPRHWTSYQDDYGCYHEVLNRAVWSPLKAARILLMVQCLDRDDGPSVFGVDETLERRRGASIRARGIYRDAVRSSRHQLVKAIGCAGSPRCS